MAIPFEDELRRDILSFVHSTLAQQSAKGDTAAGESPGRYVAGGLISDATPTSLTFTTKDGYKFRLSIEYLGAMKSVFVPVGHLISVREPVEAVQEAPGWPRTHVEEVRSR